MLFFIFFFKVNTYLEANVFIDQIYYSYPLEIHV